MSTETPRIKLVVAYDGTDFRGFAAQTGHRTVQSTLTEAVRRVTGEELEITGASRTDGGAHAEGQVVHFDTAVKLPVHRWARVLNRLLPPDLRVTDAESVDGNFHSRFSADFRRYHYRIIQSDSDPFAGRYAYTYTRNLSLQTMREAAGRLVGKHDFCAFTEELDPYVTNTVRELHRVEVNETSNGFVIEIDGNAFLRGMMRRMAGFLIEVGRGYRPVSDTETLFSPQRDQLQWPVVLPAKGLCLMRVEYKKPYVNRALQLP